MSVILSRFEVVEPRIRPEEGFYRSDVEVESFYRSDVEAPDRQPILTYLPVGFEARYAYPLVLFFHGRGRTERQLIRLAPRISRRNYVCASIRGPELVTDREDERSVYGWGADTESEAITEEYVFRALEHLQEKVNIHPERIFLAGQCEGASVAYRLGLAYPDRFAGVIALNGQMPSRTPLFRYPEVRSLRVMIGHGIANSVIPVSAATHDHRRLYSAGLPVDFKTYMTNHRMNQSMLRDANGWIMQSINAT